MDEDSRQKKEPWRIAVGILAIAFILYQWVEKDIVTIYTTMSREQIVPMIATTVLVALAKVGAITGVILLFKWILRKFSGPKN